MTENVKNLKKENHAVYMRDREYIHLVGIYDVMSFDDRGIIMQTQMGILSLDGENLKIVSFTSANEHRSQQEDDIPTDCKGDIVIEGKINGFFYTDDSAPEDKKGFFGKFVRR